MDIEKAANREVFRPLVSIFIPGAVAITPYLIVAQHRVPGIDAFWKDHDGVFVTLIIASAIAAGLAMEDIGASIEFYLVDAILTRKRPKHRDDWKEYLQLKIKDEYIGQRYIRDLVIRLKFELSMSPALIICWLGLIWVQCIYSTWTACGFLVLSSFLIGVSGIMFLQACLTGMALSDTRALLLSANQISQPTNTR
jgi:hypothetical protein